MKERLEDIFGKEFFEFVAIIIFILAHIVFLFLLVLMAVEFFHTLDVIFFGN